MSFMYIVFDYERRIDLGCCTCATVQEGNVPGASSVWGFFPFVLLQF